MGPNKFPKISINFHKVGAKIKKINVKKKKKYLSHPRNWNT